jgi:hypothetical protein
VASSVKSRLRHVVSHALGGALLVSANAAPAQSVTCPTDTGHPSEMEKKGRELFDEALRREPADPRGALEILTCVQRFADKPAVSLRVGIIAERLGNQRLAADSFERYLALAGDAAPDKKEMKAHIAQLRKEIARLASKRAPEPETEPEPEPDPVPSEPRADTRSTTPGWIVIGAGGAAMLVGGVLLLSAKNKSDEVHAIEPRTTRWNSADAKDKLDSARREQTFGVIGLAAGAAAVTAGVWLVLDAKGHVSATASVGRGHAGGSLAIRF